MVNGPACFRPPSPKPHIRRSSSPHMCETKSSSISWKSRSLFFVFRFLANTRSFRVSISLPSIRHPTSTTPRYPPSYINNANPSPQRLRQTTIHLYIYSTGDGWTKRDEERRRGTKRAFLCDFGVSCGPAVALAGGVETLGNVCDGRACAAVLARLKVKARGVVAQQIRVHASAHGARHVLG